MWRLSAGCSCSPSSILRPLDERPVMSGRAPGASAAHADAAHPPLSVAITTIGVMTVAMIGVDGLLTARRPRYRQHRRWFFGVGGRRVLDHVMATLPPGSHAIWGPFRHPGSGTAGTLAMLSRGGED